MQNKTKNKKTSNSQFMQIGFLLILLGLIFAGYQFCYVHKIRAHQMMGQKMFKKTVQKEKKEKKETIIQTEEVKNENTEELPKQPSISYQYIGIISIPKIGLKQGFVEISDPHNNIEENVTILQNSSYPDVLNGNFILAAHSGTGAIAYFNQLYQLEKHDTIYVEYKNKEYQYEIVNIYEQDKTGKVDIYRDRNKSTITLITCTNHNAKTQTIYIGNLVS